MKLPSFVSSVLMADRVNFAVTNWLPRRSVTRLVGWFSRLEQPLIRDVSIELMSLFAGDLALHEARRQTFRSLHDCFTRELRPDARPIDADPGAIVSPCDGIVVACGVIRGDELLQAKRHRYSLDELLADRRASERYRDGQFVTIRLTTNMYHRFHAPDACRIERVTSVPGDLFNVNPPALERVPRLYCRNERVVIHARLEQPPHAIALVAVGAILVGSIELLGVRLPRRPESAGPVDLPWDTSVRKGQELGYFHHGSTIIIVAGAGVARHERVREGARVRMGERLLMRERERPEATAS
jgi:phosphatidylserine decarboxylase